MIIVKITITFMCIQVEVFIETRLVILTRGGVYIEHCVCATLD